MDKAGNFLALQRTISLGDFRLSWLLLGVMPLAAA
jgi:hypothetical protein